MSEIEETLDSKKAGIDVEVERNEGWLFKVKQQIWLAFLVEKEFWFLDRNKGKNNW